jgi:hypothetical protein
MKPKKVQDIDLSAFDREDEPVGEDRVKVLRQLTRESEWLESEQIRRLLALPMNKRTHFLRRRVGRGSTL